MAPSPISTRPRTGAALKALIDERARAGREPLRFAVVHPHSGHNYELRYWLAACGVDPTRDIEIVIVPPPFMADALGAGRIDGYCVGEPWNSAAVMRRQRPHRHGQGRHLEDQPGKGRRRAQGLGRGERRHARRSAAGAAPLGALVPGKGQPRGAGGGHGANRATSVCPLQSRCRFSPAVSSSAAASSATSRISSFPSTRLPSFPWKSHALWFYTQMVRWGQVPHTPHNQRIAARLLPPRPLPRGAEAARRGAAGGKCQGRGRAQARQPPSARPAPAWCSARTASSTARCSIQTRSTPIWIASKPGLRPADQGRDSIELPGCGCGPHDGMPLYWLNLFWYASAILIRSLRAIWTRHGPAAQEQSQLPDDQCHGRAGGAQGPFLAGADQHSQASPFARTAQRQRDQRRPVAAAVDGRDQRSGA